MELIVGIICFFSSLLVPKDQVDPVVQIEANHLGFKQFSMSFDKVIT